MVRVMGWGIPEQGWRKGPWTSEEDKLLTEYVSLHGEGRWSSVARSAGLNRSGKSCRLRWVNYLRPGLKRGQLTPQEEGIIIELHALWGNKWSTIARCLPGRTDNEIKNYWRTHFKKPSQNRGKHKTQAMERQKQQKKQQQQQQQQQQQHQLEQQQQQQQQHHPIDMQRILSHLAEGDYRMPLPQTRQEMIFMYPTLEDQCFPVMFQEGTSLGDSMGEEGLWGGLWNLDDVPAHFDQPCDTNKVTWQNQASSLLGGK